MSAWTEVQETLYEAWAAGWDDATPFAFANEPFDPAGATHVRVRIQEQPGAQETLGRPGNRKMGRRGVVYALLRVPTGSGVKAVSDLAGNARAIFEGRRFDPHNIRFAECQVGAGAEIDGGAWWGVPVECPFQYEEII